MREPDARFLQLLPRDRGVYNNIGCVDLHFPRRLVTGRALSNAVLRLRLFRDGEGFVCPVLRIRSGHRQKASAEPFEYHMHRFLSLKGTWFTSRSATARGILLAFPPSSALKPERAPP